MVRAWYMDDKPEDQRNPHHLDPPQFVTLEDLYKLTLVEYFKFDLNSDQEKLEELKRNRGYTYEDELVCSEKCMENYEEKLKMFFKEHLHTDEEIRLVVEGSGYFDVRDKFDKWIRIEVVPGDLLVLPAGIYHRFTLDNNNYIRAKRFFVGEPVWTAHNRPVDDMPSRVSYLKTISGKA